MGFRVNIFLACLAGSVIASLAGILVAVKYDAGLLSLFLSVVIPAGFCNYAGLHDRRCVATIATYAAIGWIIGAMLTPGVAMGPSSQLRNIIDSQLAGHAHLLPCVVISSVLANLPFVFRKTYNAKHRISIRMRGITR